MKPSIPLRAALADPQLLGGTLVGDSWKAWRTLLIAAMGEPLDDTERAIYKKLTQRDREPSRRVEEFVGVIGRRGGKSRAISVLASYIAGLCEHPALVSGERGVLLIIAPDQRQAQIILDYITATLEASPILRQLIESRTQWSLRLTNKIDIEVRASDFRRLRGLTLIFVICDESAFWYNNENSANPDSEILNAVRPGLATTAGSLFMISSPYAKRGELWSLYKRHYGPNGDPAVLVAQGSSRTFNPTLAQSVVDRAFERDPAAAGAEYMAQFRSDLEAFVSFDVVHDGCVIRGLYEKPPQHGVQYAAFCDPSGGSSDSMTLAIGSFDHGRGVVMLDAIRETKPPFSPENVVAEYSHLLKSYGIARLVGDRWGGVWCVESFERHGISYEQSAKPKSDLYIDLLPLLNSGRIHLLDHPKLVSQLTNLERRTSRGGKDSIDYAPGAHDDLANAVAGLCSTLTQQPGLDYRGYLDSGVDDDPYGVESWRRFQRHVYLESHGQVIIR
jgi:hypothetical protein